MDMDKTENEKELNRQAQRAADSKNVVSDEEYAEKIYDEDAPTPPQFEEQHDVSYTGSEMKE
jgi:hypothetical protein